MLSFDYLSDFTQSLDDIPVGETTDTESIKNGIDIQISTLKRNLNIVSEMVHHNENLKSYIETIESDIIPRFGRYDNFTGCGVAFETSDNTLTATFEMSSQVHPK